MRSATPPTEEALGLAVRFLVERQLPHGEFATLASVARSLAEPCRWDSSPFVTTFALYALGLTGHEEARPAIERGLRFLLDEREAPGLWRYWTSRNPRRVFIPPDMDDTCCASWILRRHGLDPGPNEPHLLANRDSTGRFRTWFAPDDGVDAVVNANALLYLGERAETAAARAYVVGTIDAGSEATASPFYADPLSLYYTLSRAYRHGVAALGSVADTVRRRTEARQDAAGWVEDALTTALAACTWLNFGGSSEGLDRAIASLVAAQRPDGSWPKVGMYVDTPGQGPPSWYGSDELTTSLCVEALAEYLRR
jgi:hypothetical protein